MKKERLDALLTARGLFESRARAQAAIMAGAGGGPGKTASRLPLWQVRCWSMNRK